MGELERAESHSTSRDVSGTESSQVSWLREETSLKEMELAESPSMERSSLMRTSSTSTLDQESSQWPTPDQELTDLNSSSASMPSHILMESTSSLERLLMVWKFSEQWSRLDPRPEEPKYHVISQTVESSNEQLNLLSERIIEEDMIAEIKRQRPLDD